MCWLTFVSTQLEIHTPICRIPWIKTWIKTWTVECTSQPANKSCSRIFYRKTYSRALSDWWLRIKVWFSSTRGPSEMMDQADLVLITYTISIPCIKTTSLLSRQDRISRKTKSFKASLKIRLEFWVINKKCPPIGYLIYRRSKQNHNCRLTLAAMLKIPKWTLE